MKRVETLKPPITAIASGCCISGCPEVDVPIALPDLYLRQRLDRHRTTIENLHRQQVVVEE